MGNTGNAGLLLQLWCCLHPVETVIYLFVCLFDSGVHLLVEEHPGADDKLEDVLQGLHGLQQLLCQLLCVVYVVLQDLGQFPTHAQSHIHTHTQFNQSADHIFG